MTKKSDEQIRELFLVEISSDEQDRYAHFAIGIVKDIALKAYRFCETPLLEEIRKLDESEDFLSKEIELAANKHLKNLMIIAELKSELAKQAKEIEELKAEKNEWMTNCVKRHNHCEVLQSKHTRMIERLKSLEVKYTKKAYLELIPITYEYYYKNDIDTIIKEYEQ